MDHTLVNLLCYRLLRKVMTNNQIEDLGGVIRVRYRGIQIFYPARSLRAARIKDMNNGTDATAMLTAASIIGPVPSGLEDL